MLDEIRREVYPDDYADGLKALSMVMVSELRWCAEALQLEPGSVFVDLGCGLGGPGQWLANATSTAVIGVEGRWPSTCSSVFPDTAAALAELARTLQPGARLAASTRELRSSGSGDLPIQILVDHEPMLRAAGFELLRREEPLSGNIQICVTLDERPGIMYNPASPKAAPAESPRPAQPDYPHQATTWPNYPEVMNLAQLVNRFLPRQTALLTSA